MLGGLSTKYATCKRLLDLTILFVTICLISSNGQAILSRNVAPPHVLRRTLWMVSSCRLAYHFGPVRTVQFKLCTPHTWLARSTERATCTACGVWGRGDITTNNIQIFPCYFSTKKVYKPDGALHLPPTRTHTCTYKTGGPCSRILMCTDHMW